MTMAGEILRRQSPAEVDLCGGSGQELHVLAVDDSLVDRKVIEKLLKRLSCKGGCLCFLVQIFLIYPALGMI